MWQMIIPKTGFREKYDLENEWLASGIPQTLSLDNSKAFRSKSLQDACQSLGIGIKHGRPRAPHLRGAIERQFRSLNSLFHAVPGTTFSNVVARADYPSEKLAVVSLQDLIRMLVIQLVDLYAESHHSGLGNIPARRWEAALEGGFIPRVPSDVRELRIILGRLDFRTVQHYGIDLNSIRYNSQDLAPLRTMIKKYPTQFGKEVKLKYHPGDLSHVYVFDPFQEIYIEVPAIDEEYTQQLSLWKHRIIKRYARAKEDREDPVSLGIAKRKLMNIVDEARSQKKIGTRARIGRFDRAGQTPSLQELPESRSMTKKPIEEKSTSSMDSDFKQPVRDIADPLDEPVDEGWSIGIAKDQNEDNL
jgi:putative transposase